MDIAPHFPNRKVNLEALQEVYTFLERYPGTKSLKVGRILKLNNNVYRYIKLLQDARLIDDNNVPTTINKKKDREFRPPVYLNAGIGLNGKWTNIANMLAHTADGEKVAGWDMTKEEVTNYLQEYWGKAYKEEELLNMYKTVQEVFAMGAIHFKEFEAFKNMTNTTPVGKEEFK